MYYKEIAMHMSTDSFYCTSIDCQRVDCIKNRYSLPKFRMQRFLCK